MELNEQMYAMYLNNANEVLGVINVGKGNVSNTPANVVQILQGALLCNASGVLICHNHPSGNTFPSRNDKLLTEKVKQACELFDIKLVDHIIICCNDYYSFNEIGLL